MPRRCKLISPTNLMLEHPILGPVDEAEFVIFGVKEHGKFLARVRTEALAGGVLLGMFVAGAIVALVRFLAEIGVH